MSAPKITATPSTERLRLLHGGESTVIPQFIGTSSHAADVRNEIAKLAPLELATLITGETGTGKDVVARRLHATGARAGGPFVAINCASVPESLAESTFFGHVRGAFSGADADREGALVAASGGTLFLDELGEMPLTIQAKLLRGLEDGNVRPVGSSEDRKVDLRIISATHRDPWQLVEEGRFRADLYYRLCVATIDIAPLRDRLEDVESLVQHFVGELEDVPVEMSPCAMRALESELWLGNVRELRHRVTLLAHLARDGRVDRQDVIDTRRKPRTKSSTDPLVTRVAPLKQIERDAIRLALGLTGGNRAAAAEHLGISRASIYQRIKKFGLDAG